jgi:hypothetical protein
MCRTSALAIWLLAALPVRAGVSIPAADRVSNLNPGCCTWACFEMAGNFLGIKALKGITAARQRRTLELVQGPGGTSVPRNDHGGTPERVRDELGRRGVRYSEQPDWVKDDKILFSSVRRGLPVSISLHGYPLLPDGRPDWSSYHAVLLTDIDEKSVRVIDPNEAGRDLTFGRPWLDRHWTGRAVVLEPDVSAVAATAASPRAPPAGRPGPPRLAWGPPGLSEAVSRGRAGCEAYLVDEMKMTRAEASVAVARIWGDQ